MILFEIISPRFVKAADFIEQVEATSAGFEAKKINKLDQEIRIHDKILMSYQDRMHDDS